MKQELTNFAYLQTLQFPFLSFLRYSFTYSLPKQNIIQRMTKSQRSAGSISSEMEFKISISVFFLICYWSKATHIECRDIPLLVICNLRGTHEAGGIKSSFIYSIYKKKIIIFNFHKNCTASAFEDCLNQDSRNIVHAHNLAMFPGN